MSKGEINAALSLIPENGKGGVLQLTLEVRAALRAKHPSAQPAAEVLLPGEPPVVNPIIFEGFIGITIRRTALAIQGAAGPSMADAYVWTRMLVSFKTMSNELPV